MSTILNPKVIRLGEKDIIRAIKTQIQSEYEELKDEEFEIVVWFNGTLQVSIKYLT